MPITIMLVDDNPTFLRVTTEFLEAHDDMHVVGKTNDGRQALTDVLALHPQVVLTDLAMPGLHGLEFIPRLRERLPGTHIVALSVMDSFYFRNAALSAGADAFVSKAQLRTELLPTIRQLARDGSAESIAPTHQPPTNATQAHTRRVLVMDDDAHLRQIYSRALEGAGYEVHSAATTQAARDLLSQTRFDVLLCDIHMGNERGTDLLQDCSDALFTSGAQVIMVSGQARYRDMCEEMGADFFLEKPVTMSTLVALVNRLTARRVPTDIPANKQAA